MSILNKDQIKDVIELYNIKTVEDAHDAVKDLMKDVLERALEAELSNTLGYDNMTTRTRGLQTPGMVHTKKVCVHHWAVCL